MWPAERQRRDWAAGSPPSYANLARLALAAAGAGLIVGALLPWARIAAPRGASLTLTSVQRGNQGWAILLIGAVVIGLVALLPGRWSWLASTACGLLGVAVGLRNWAHVQQILDRSARGHPDRVQGSIGAGLWVTVIAAVAVVVLSIWLAVTDRGPVPVRRG